MYFIVKGYVNEMKRLHGMYEFIPNDLINLILLFYMYDLSQYEYIAIFLAKLERGHFTAFNIIDIDTDNDKVMCNIDCSDSAKLCQEELGTTVKMYELNQFPEEIRQNLFPKYKRININSEKNKLHVMFRLEGENKSADNKNKCTAYLIETDDIYELPISSISIDRCALLLSKKYSLIALGGYEYTSSTAYNQVQILRLDEIDEDQDKTRAFYWDPTVISAMNTTRSNHGIYMMEQYDKIFVCGGWTNSSYGDTKTAEIYSFNNNDWTDINSMNHSHLCHGVIMNDINTQNMFIVGGTRLHQCQLVETYNFHQNCWSNLPNTIYQHKWFPDIKIKNGSTLICVGNHYNYIQDDTNEHGWGFAEYLDLRDSHNKWQSLNQKSIHQILGYNDKKECHKKMRGIWSL